MSIGSTHIEDKIDTLIGTPVVDVSTDIATIDTLIGTPAGADVVADIAVIDGYHDVPTADATTDANIRDVVGRKTDTANATVGDTSSLMRYMKGILTKTNTFMVGTCEAGSGVTTIVCSALAGYGTDYFNNKWWAYCVQNANSIGNAPEGEYRRITDYVTASGTFTVNTFSAALETGDLIVIIHESSLGLQTKEWVAAGNYTFTIPTDVYLIDEVLIVGGGAGGGGGGSGDGTGVGSDGTAGGAGGNSSFVGFTANGGAAGKGGNKAGVGGHGAAQTATVTTPYSIPLTTAPSTTVPYSSVLVLNGGASGASKAGGSAPGSAGAGVQSFAPASTGGAQPGTDGGAGSGGGSSLGQGGNGGAGSDGGAVGGNAAAATGYGAGGGGGGGGGGNDYDAGGATGGSGGAVLVVKNYPVYPAVVMTLTVGAAGALGAGGVSGGTGSYAGGDGTAGIVGCVRITWRERSVAI